MVNLLELVCLALAVAGVALLSLPAALIVAGLLGVAILERRSPR